MMALGIIIGVLIVLLLVGLTVAIYFFMDNAISNKGKKGFTVIFIGVMYLITLTIRVTVMSIFATKYLEGGFADGILKGFEAFFTTGGGLTFEGQEVFEAEGASVPIVLNILYYGSIVWLAFTFFALISVNLNYEFNSFLKNRVFTPCWRSKKEDVYIFTSVSEDSLSLAKSIKDAQGKKACIVFMGDDIDPFDKDNELHREIRANKFLYSSLVRNENLKKHEPLTMRVGRTHTADILRLLRLKDVHIFAMDNDKDLTGYETRNSDVILDDIKAIKSLLEKQYGPEDNLVKEIKRTDLVRPAIYYYVLSNNDLNFEFYLESVGYKLFSTGLFQIKIINEAFLTGEDLIYQRIGNLGIDKYSLDGDMLINETKDHKYKALVLGFGQTGQQALENMLMDTSSVKKDGNLYIPNDFEADIYDLNIDKIIGGYTMDHPSIIFQDMDEVIEPVFDKDGKPIPQSPTLYNKDVIMNHYGISEEDQFNKLDLLMKFPRFKFARKNYNDLDLLKDISDKTRIDKVDSYNAVIIALGSDENNIKCANTIINNIRKRNYHKGVDKLEGQTLRIFVNIRSGNNNLRINWNDELEEELRGKIHVYLFGNAEEIYSYDRIVDNRFAIRFNRSYEIITSLIYGSRPYEFGYFMGEATKEIKEMIKKQVDLRDPAFLELTPDKKISNEKVALFSKYYSLYSYDTAETSVDWDYLRQLEHTRWNRYMITAGSIYTSDLNASYKNDALTKINKYEPFDKQGIKDPRNYVKSMVKLHHCLVPYSKFEGLRELDSVDKAYDVGIVYAVYVYSHNAQSKEQLLDTKNKEYSL